MTINDALLREADVYLAASLAGNIWSRAQELTRQRALTSAARQLETVLGSLCVPEQTFRYAVFEQAVFLLDEDMQSAVKARQKGISSASVGHASESYRDDLPTEKNGIVLSPMANSILQPFFDSKRIIHGRLIP